MAPSKRQRAYAINAELNARADMVRSCYSRQTPFKPTTTNGGTRRSDVRTDASQNDLQFLRWQRYNCTSSPLQMYATPMVPVSTDCHYPAQWKSVTTDGLIVPGNITHERSWKSFRRPISGICLHLDHSRCRLAPSAALAHRYQDTLEINPAVRTEAGSTLSGE